MVKVVIILDSHPQKVSGPPGLQVTTASPSLLASHIDVTGPEEHRGGGVSKLSSVRDSWVQNFPGQESREKGWAGDEGGMAVRGKEATSSYTPSPSQAGSLGPRSL